MPKRPARRAAPVSLMAKELAAKLVKLHDEYGSIGPLLFGISADSDALDGGFR